MPQSRPELFPEQTVFRGNDNAAARELLAPFCIGFTMNLKHGKAETNDKPNQTKDSVLLCFIHWDKATF